jgi:hypothetical protein
MKTFIVAMAAGASACGASTPAPVPCSISLTGAAMTIYSCLVKMENAGSGSLGTQIDMELDSSTPGMQLNLSLIIGSEVLFVGTSSTQGPIFPTGFVTLNLLNFPGPTADTRGVAWSATSPGDAGTIAFTVSDVGPASSVFGPWMHFHGSIDAVMPCVSADAGTITLNASF